MSGGIVVLFVLFALVALGSGIYRYSKYRNADPEEQAEMRSEWADESRRANEQEMRQQMNNRNNFPH